MAKKRIARGSKKEGPPSPRPQQQEKEKEEQEAEAAAPVVLSAERKAELADKARRRSARQEDDSSGVDLTEKRKSGIPTRVRSGSWRGTVLRSSLSYEDDSEGGEDFVISNSPEEEEEEEEEKLDEEASDQVYVWGSRVPTFNTASPAPRKLKLHGLESSVAQLALGNDHYVLLTDAHRVWTWGIGEMGQLGHPEKKSFYAPKMVEKIEEASFVAAGGLQSAALTKAGLCLMWGWAGPTGPRPVVEPTLLQGMEQERIESLALGEKHGIAATSQGSVFVWGANIEGQLGDDGNQEFAHRPTEVVLPERCFFVSASECGSASVSTKGSVFYWGKSWKAEDKVYWKPTKLGFTPIGRDKVTKCALGSRHILCMTLMGRVLGMGNGESGQLGNGIPPQSSLSDPVIIRIGGAQAAPAAPPSAVDHEDKRGLRSLLSKNRSPSMGSLMGHQVLSRGRRSGSIGGRSGTIGGRLRDSGRNSSSMVALTPASRCKDLAAAGNTSMALTEDGKVWMWGTSDVIVMPRIIKELEDISMAGIVCTPTCGAVLVGLKSEEDLKFHSFNPPIIRAASLERLVDWISSEKTKPSPLYSYTLLLTHHSFTDTQTLLRLVRERYSMGNEFVRNKLSHFMVKWLQERSSDFRPPERRAEIDNFIELMATSTIVHVLQRIVTRLDEDPSESADEEQPEALASADVARILHQKSPTVVAEELTLQEHKLFSKIDGREFLGQGWSKPDKLERAPGIVAMTQRFNDLSRRITNHIINCQSKSDRTQRYQWWVEVHRQLFNLNNLNTCVCVGGALSSVPIERLVKRSLIEVKTSSAKWLSYFGDLLKKNNKAGYRKALKRIMNEDEPGIPYIGVHMSDLTFLEDGNQDFLDENLINFRKQRLIAKQVRTLEQLAGRQFSGLKSDPELAKVFGVIVAPSQDELDKVAQAIIDSATGGAAAAAKGSARSSRAEKPRSNKEAPAPAPVVVEEKEEEQGEKKRAEVWAEMVQDVGTPMFEKVVWPTLVSEVLQSPIVSMEEEAVFTQLAGGDPVIVDMLQAVSLTEPDQELVDRIVEFCLSTTSGTSVREGLLKPLDSLRQNYVQLMQHSKAAEELYSVQKMKHAQANAELESKRKKLLSREEELKLELMQVQREREQVEEQLAYAEVEHENADKNVKKKVTILRTSIADASEALSVQEKAVDLFDQVLLRQVINELESFRSGDKANAEDVRQQFVNFSRHVVLPIIQHLSTSNSTPERAEDARQLGQLLKEIKAHIFPPKQ